MTLSRREMIVASVAAFSLATASRTASANEPQRKFTIDLRWTSIGVQANQNEAIALAAKHGFESVAAAPHDLTKLTDAENDVLIGQLKEKGLVWGSSALPVDFRKDEATFKKDLAALPDLAKSLHRAGVDRMGTWISPCHDELTYVANFKQHADRLRECANILRDHGLRFGLEYVGTSTLRNSKRYPFLHTMRETAELHAAIGVDNMGFVLDSWHWYTAGESADDIRSLNPAQIVGCDLNDAPSGIDVNAQLDNQRELPSATGVIDVRSFLQALIDVGYDGPVRAEPFNKTLNEQDNDTACANTAQAIRKAIATLG